MVFRDKGVSEFTGTHRHKGHLSAFLGLCEAGNPPKQASKKTLYGFSDFDSQNTSIYLKEARCPIAEELSVPFQEFSHQD